MWNLKFFKKKTSITLPGLTLGTALPLHTAQRFKQTPRTRHCYPVLRHKNGAGNNENYQEKKKDKERRAETFGSINTSTRKRHPLARTGRNGTGAAVGGHSPIPPAALRTHTDTAEGKFGPEFLRVQHGIELRLNPLKS